MDEHTPHTAVAGLLGRSLAVERAAEALAAKPVIGTYEPTGMPGTEIRERTGLWAYLMRACDKRGTAGTNDLFEGLRKVPAGSQVLICWFEDDEHAYGVFTDTAASVLHGIVGVPKENPTTAATVPNGRRVHRVKVMGADGAISDSVVTCQWRENNAGDDKREYMDITFCIDLETAGESFQGVGRDYFDALVDLRKQLDPLGLRLLCFGARRDTWASGMQRDMASGSEAYLLSDPRPGRKPAFSIWDYAPPETIGTVADQAEYSKKWSSRRR